MHTRTHRLKLALDIATVLVGSAIGIGGWGVLGWMISIISAVRILSARPGASVSRQSAGSYQRPLVPRVLLASVAVFSLTMIVTMLVAHASNPNALGRAEWLSIPVLAAVGMLSAVEALRMIWH